MNSRRAIGWPLMGVAIGMAGATWGIWYIKTANPSPSMKLVVGLAVLLCMTAPWLSFVFLPGATCGGMRGRQAAGMLFAAFLAGASIIATSFLLKYASLGPAARLAVALLPTPFYAIMVWVIVRGVRSLDEMWQKIQLDALAFAFPTSLVGLVTVGYLVKAGFLRNFEGTDFTLILIAAYLVGYVLAIRRYK